jgi:DNA-binding NtrC family response regulator
MDVNDQGGNMTPGYQEDQMLDCESVPGLPSVPVTLGEDIRCAARSDVTVLISGAPDQCREIACAIDRQSSTPRGSVEVIDCRQRGAFTRALSLAPRWPAERTSILLLQEVHALSRNEQTEIDSRLAEIKTFARNAGIRIVASSSAPLFERVQNGAFDARLFYRLNVIHMVV